MQAIVEQHDEQIKEIEHTAQEVNANTEQGLSLTEEAVRLGMSLLLDDHLFLSDDRFLQQRAASARRNGSVSGSVFALSLSLLSFSA